VTDLVPVSTNYAAADLSAELGAPLRLRWTAGDSQVSIAAAPSSDDVHVRVPGRDLREALANLLDNAVRHAAATVTVHARACDGFARVAVADDGPGVPADVRDRIFERFSAHGPSAGTGLGLAIARDIARRHGGDISCDADGFHLTLPLGDA
jgi:signal transduction histidine kinase